MVLTTTTTTTKRVGDDNRGVVVAVVSGRSRGFPKGDGTLECLRSVYVDICCDHDRSTGSYVFHLQPQQKKRTHGRRMPYYGRILQYRHLAPYYTSAHLPTIREVLLLVDFRPCHTVGSYKHQLILHINTSTNDTSNPSDKSTMGDAIEDSMGTNEPPGEQRDR
mmetsp:Transcript_22964/g.34067  ORF Transcript_22964/g.34067 Transcript_22964/m.34067 type:complete len:164 (-) Transcript_22964:166-657(-)